MELNKPFIFWIATRHQFCFIFSKYCIGVVSTNNRLVGENHVNTSYIPDWPAVDNIASQIDGCFTPKDCTPRQKVAIIIPYKNREEHLKSLLATLHPMLQRQDTAYCIFVSEQVRSNPNLIFYTVPTTVPNNNCFEQHGPVRIHVIDPNTLIPTRFQFLVGL